MVVEDRFYVSMVSEKIVPGAMFSGVCVGDSGLMGLGSTPNSKGAGFQPLYI